MSEMKHMTDRELLEKSVKAIGMGYVPEHAWNPLTDDGDALRLAHSLKTPVSIDISAGLTIVSGWYFDVSEDHGDDSQAATRRAIVRAAAAIGESL
jgi:hypothetical protein